MAVVVAVAALAPADLSPYRPIPQELWPEDALSPGEGELNVRWPADWDKVLADNVPRWEKALEAAAAAAKAAGGPAPKVAAERLACRRYRLLEAMLDRFPATSADQGFAAYRQIAADLDRIGEVHRANHYRKRLIDSLPGRYDVAVEQLDAILDRTQRTQPPEAQDWYEYASDRVFGLVRLGQLAERHPLVGKALQGRVSWAMSRGDLPEAGRAIDRAVARSGWEAWSLSDRARLLDRAGRGQEALATWRAVVEKYHTTEGNQAVSAFTYKVSTTPPLYGRSMSLEMRWEGLRNKPLAPAAEAIGELLAAAADDGGLTPVRDGYASIWQAVDAQLRALPADALAELRRLQQAALTASGRETSGLTPDLALRLFREYPWAPAAHGALLAAAETALRQGRFHWAGASFRDVLTRSADAATLARARVGLLLALAQDPREGPELRRLLAELPQTAMLPLGGGLVSVTDLAARLGVASAGAAEPSTAPARSGASLKDLRISAVSFPGGAAWPSRPLTQILDGPVETFWPLLGQFHVEQGKIGTVPDFDQGPANAPRVSTKSVTVPIFLLSGPTLLACYRPSPATAGSGSEAIGPVWVRRAPMSFGSVEIPPPQLPAAPGHFRPAVAGGRLYSRWAMDPADGEMTSVAAFDLDDGSMLWSTSGDPAWDQLRPVSDPTFADGRLYLLAAPPGGFIALKLVCMDAADGRVLWQRLTGTQEVAIGRNGRADSDVVHFGSAVTVQGGEVIASTGLGHVMAFDARDGLARWTSDYDRATDPRWTPLCLERRLGGPPVVVGGMVLVAPRDCRGVLAFDRSNGRMLWDNPLVPSDEIVGLVEQVSPPVATQPGKAGPQDRALLVLRNAVQLVGLNVADGSVRWQYRFDERPVAASAALIGREVVLAAGRSVVRIDAEDGEVLESVPWPLADPPVQTVLAGDRLLAVTATSTTTPAGVPPAPTATPAVVPTAPTATPAGVPTAAKREEAALLFRHEWLIRRDDPELIVPPDARAAGEVFIVSGDVLEAVRLTGDGDSPRTTWRRAIPPGRMGIEWVGTGRTAKMVLIYDTQALAIDRGSGRLLWQCRWPFTAYRWRLYDDPGGASRLVVGAWPGGRDLALVDLADGKLLWHRPLHALLGYYETIDGVSRHGEILQVLVPDTASQRGLLEILLRLSDGETVAVRRLPHIYNEIIAAGEGGFYLDTGNKLRTLPPGGVGKVLAFDADMSQARGPVIELRRVGKWLKLTFAQAGGTWVLDPARPDFAFHHPGPLTVEGDTAIILANGHIVIADVLPGGTLRSPRQVTCQAADIDGGVLGRLPAGFWVDGDRLLCLWGNLRGTYPRHIPRDLQLDTFEKSSGRRLGTQRLPDISYRVGSFGSGRVTNQPALLPGVGVGQGSLFLVTDPAGLHAFASAAPPTRTVNSPPRERGVMDEGGDSSPPQATVAYRPAKPIVLDGRLDEWDLASAEVLTAAGSWAGKLALAVEAERPAGEDAVCLAVVAEAGKGTALVSHPLRGALPADGGDRLEIAIASGWLHGAEHRLRLICGIDGEGRFVCLRPGGGPDLAGITGRVRHDPAAGTIVYELRIPKDVLASHRIEGNRLSMSAAVWADDATGRPRPVLTWGEGIDGLRTDPARYRPVSFRDLTSSQESALLDLAEKLPELEPSCLYFHESVEARATCAAHRAAAWTGWLTRHPKSPQAVRAMIELDHAARRETPAGAAPEVLAVAARAGVPAETVDAYRRIAEPHLSVWVLVEKAPAMIGVETTFWRVTRRAQWGNSPAWDVYGGRGGIYAGDMPPAGVWQELRVSLLALGMLTDRVEGVRFCQLSGQAVWDRAVLVAGDKTLELFDDDLPGKAADQNVTWTDTPVHSGKRAFRLKPAFYMGNAGVSAQGIGLTEPFTAHIAKLPGSGAIDPKKLQAILTDALPGCGPIDESVAYFRELARLTGDDPARQAELCEWFVRLLPGHPRAPEVLADALAARRKAGQADAAGRIEALIEQLKLPAWSIYQYHRRAEPKARAPIARWQVIGSFPGGQDAYPPLAEGVDLSGTYVVPGATGGEGVRLRWQPAAPADGVVALTGAAAGDVAFAVCWVYLPRAQTVVMETLARGGGEVYVNGREVARIALKGDTRRVDMPGGWSEVLLAFRQGRTEGGAALEIVEPRGAGQPEGIKLSDRPPARTDTAPASGPASDGG